MIDMDSPVQKATNIAMRIEIELGQERAINREVLAYAKETKTPPPDHYWVKEYQLREKLRAARALVEVLMDERAAPV